MAKSEKTLDNLFHETLKDIYFAEKKVLTALPKMAKAAQSEQLRAAFEKHEVETEGQIERLQQVFALIEQPPKGKTCDAINGIIKEGQEIIKDFKGTEALDAGLLAAAQAVEHYEISRYGTLKAWAGQLGLQKAVSLLDRSLQEEKNTDEALSHLAEGTVNREAAERLGGRTSSRHRPPQPEAQRRVDEALTEAKILEAKARTRPTRRAKRPCWQPSSPPPRSSPAASPPVPALLWADGIATRIVRRHSSVDGSGSCRETARVPSATSAMTAVGQAATAVMALDVMIMAPGRRRDAL